MKVPLMIRKRTQYAVLTYTHTHTQIDRKTRLLDLFFLLRSMQDLLGAN